MRFLDIDREGDPDLKALVTKRGAFAYRNSSNGHVHIIVGDGFDTKGIDGIDKKYSGKILFNNKGNKKAGQWFWFRTQATEHIILNIIHLYRDGTHYYLTFDDLIEFSKDNILSKFRYTFHSIIMLKPFKCYYEKDSSYSSDGGFLDYMKQISSTDEVVADYIKFVKTKRIDWC